MSWWAANSSRNTLFWHRAVWHEAEILYMANGQNATGWSRIWLVWQLIPSAMALIKLENLRRMVKLTFCWLYSGSYVETDFHSQLIISSRHTAQQNRQTFHFHLSVMLQDEHYSVLEKWQVFVQTQGRRQSCQDSAHNLWPCCKKRWWIAMRRYWCDNVENSLPTVAAKLAWHRWSCSFLPWMNLIMQNITDCLKFG